MDTREVVNKLSKLLWENEEQHSNELTLMFKGLELGILRH